MYSIKHEINLLTLQMLSWTMLMHSCNSGFLVNIDWMFFLFWNFGFMNRNCGEGVSHFVHHFCYQCDGLARQQAQWLIWITTIYSAPCHGYLYIRESIPQTTIGVLCIKQTNKQTPRNWTCTPSNLRSICSLCRCWAGQRWSIPVTQGSLWTLIEYFLFWNLGS